MMVTLVEPIGYEIKVHRADGDENNFWTLRYSEFFEELDREAAQRAVEQIKKDRKEFNSVQIIGNKIVFNLVGPKELILTILASEFLFISPVGKMSLQDIFMRLSMEGFERQGG